jgi:G:T-mismatch repair DNA endonuclease (very short patch repair protein)
MAFPSRKGRYCSRPCSRADAGVRALGTIRTSQTIPCGYCGKAVKQFKSRAHYRNTFCGADCYHAWDSLYKQTPVMKRKLALRNVALGSKPSGIERRVAEWLTSHGIQFEQQVKVHYSIIDFKVGDTLIEVNGCYWHACAEHFPMITPIQQKRITRDKRVATYCRKRGIPFLVIWEHDIRRDDFSALFGLIRVPIGP